ncbi:MAG: hypothetical protein A2W85_09320 [Bacteroidetes bacterium GWF2_41_31]|nr:MAG: hypothetical protein A2W85_09320 [Bacteroidetes bacterium GWF2_41_31]
MSKTESMFIKWFGGIAGTLIIASVIGLVGMYHTSGIVSEKVKSNEKKIVEVQTFHDKDVELIRSSIKEIKSDQKVIMTDIKQILKEIR